MDQMNLEEKCALLSGAKEFGTRAFAKYDIPEMQLSDGPHGLRKQEEGANHLGLGGSIKATCFPTAATAANSWDPALGEKIGEALGEEAASMGVSVLLGPGLCMKRSPLCGRNFEYFSEDPFLAGKMAAGYIRGIQKNGIAACPKHYAVNNQELLRMSSNSILDERTLREIYLTGFEIALKEGHPKAIMSSYNLVNGTYTNENPHLLRDILRGEWGYRGVVVTDWGGSNDHVAGVENTSDLEMPVPGSDSIRQLAHAVRSGRLSEETVNDRVEELLELILPTAEVIAKAPKQFDAEAHHRIAGEAAAETIVLLKNEAHTLPLAAGTRVALIGSFAADPRYQGAGSSMVNPTKLDSLVSCMEGSSLVSVGSAEGYRRNGEPDADLIAEACALAQKAEVVLLCMGLNEIKESEGLDRSDMKINANQETLLRAVAAVNPNIVVILSGGSPMELPWLDSVKAVVNGYLGGQAGASAMCGVLTGRVNPSGKLAETWPLRLADTPAAAYYPGRKKNAEYREGLYIGYRYYRTAGVPVRFPFGYGLSYTTFAYSDMQVGEHEVRFTVTNTGDRTGAEIAELYVHKENSGIFRAEEELKGFARVTLAAGESRRITLPLDDMTFRFFDVKTNRWETEGGTYELRVGASSSDIRLKAQTEVRGTVTADELPYAGQKLDSYRTGAVRKVSDTEFETLLGSKIPDPRFHGWLDRNITFGQLKYGRSPLGWIIWAVLTLMLRGSMKRGKPNLNILFIYNMPLRALQKMTGGAFSMGMVDGLVWEINGLWVIGLIRILVEALIYSVQNAVLRSKISR